MDGIELEIFWSNLIGIVSEQAKALQRIAFSPIVREAGDLATALFDAGGRMVAQATTGTPGHINSLADAGHTLAGMFQGRLQPGDVVITNDPWLSAGHFFDITVFSPVFLDGALIAYFGSTIHHTDIGGYGIGAGARDVHEEGLWIPPSKLYEAGEPNALLHSIIRHNVRTPDQVFGDLAAQVSSGRTGAERLAAFCRRHALPGIQLLADEIITRSEAATRRTIAALPAGTWHGESRFDVPGGEVVTLHTAITIDPGAGDILIDFAGSSPPSAIGINVVRNYTHAYATFAIRSCLNPDLPNNYGSLAPIRIAAPESCIVNAQYPSPVNARHVVGMFVPMPILKALAQVVPDKVLAEGAGAVWTVQIQGKRLGRAAVHLVHVQLQRRHGGAGRQAGPQRHLLPHWRRRRAGGDTGSRHAHRVRPARAAPGQRRRRRLARRGRPGDRVPHADQLALAAERGAQPSGRGAGGAAGRRGGRARALHDQWGAEFRSAQNTDAAGGPGEAGDAGWRRVWVGGRTPTVRLLPQGGPDVIALGRFRRPVRCGPGPGNSRGSFQSEHRGRQRLARPGGCRARRSRGRCSAG